jgi:hypothetical protein
MKIEATHHGYTGTVIRRATLWAAKQIGLEGRHRQPLTIEVGYRKNRRGHGSWGGWYRHNKRLVQVLLPRAPLGYPQSMAHGVAEREQGRDANDEWELFVAILAHANAQTPKQRREAWDRLLALKAQKQRQEPNT